MTSISTSSLSLSLSSGEPNPSTESREDGVRKPPNACPQAFRDRYVVMVGEQLAIADPGKGVLANDKDPEDEGLAVVEVSSMMSEQGGIVSVHADGTFTYDPSVKFLGSDAFTYKLIDGYGCEVEGKVLLSVHPRNISLVDIANGQQKGIVISGEAEDDRAGSAVSEAGDVNGDGFADVIVSAPKADPNGDSSGRSYVVFGGPELSSIALAEVVNDQGGFVFDGEAAEDQSGISVSRAGDINGDGWPDLLLGASEADPNGDSSGRSYLVFGDPQLHSVKLAELVNNQGGFFLDGEGINHYSGRSVSDAGDINGDGFVDFMIGAGGANSKSGRGYIIFGGSELSSTTLADIVNGQGGFSVQGETPGDSAGISLSKAGDINGDGYPDLIIGADGYDFDTKFNVGRSYVVFGGPALSSLSLADIANGQGGFSVSGEVKEDFSGSSVSEAGDVNGDGYADILIGAWGFDSWVNLQFRQKSGRSYVVFGGPTLQSMTLTDIANGQGGFALDGEVEFDYSGRSVSTIGDMNGDGYADIVIGALSHDPEGKSNAGRSYVVFGGPELKSMNLAKIAQGQGGFTVDGEFDKHQSGNAVSSAGDVNGDGFADLLIGAHKANPNGAYSGRSYIIYGDDFTASVDFRPTLADDYFVGTPNPENMIGGLGNDELLGKGGADVLYGGPGNDILAITDSTFFRIDGGPGEDTLRFDGMNMHFDLRIIPELALRNIEKIDLNGQANQLTLEVRDLVASSETSNTLIIHGQPGNAVAVDLKGSGFSYQGKNPQGYIEYLASNQALRLWVHPDIDRSMIDYDKP